jgi:hypothetical protein
MSLTHLVVRPHSTPSGQQKDSVPFPLTQKYVQSLLSSGDKSGIAGQSIDYERLFFKVLDSGGLLDNHLGLDWAWFFGYGFVK